MKQKIHYRTILPLLLCLLMAMIYPGCSSAGRNGAKLELVMKDGEVITGRLLDVVGTNLILDIPVPTNKIPMENISVIIIKKKATVLKSAAMGFVIGTAIGAAIMPKAYADAIGDGGIRSRILGGTLLGVPFALIGILHGATQKTDGEFKLEGKSTHDLKEIAEKLKERARFN